MGSLGIVPNLGQIYNPDSFTGDGSEVAFTLTHLVTSDQSIIWVEGGVIQKPGIDFTISGLTLTRTTAPANLVACFAMYLGVSMDIGVPSDGTVTLAKMAVNSVDSDQYVDGSIDEAHIANDAINFATHLKAGTDGELITWDASGNPAAVPVGTSTHVLTSGGTGVAPTFQAAGASGDLRNFIIDGDFTQFPEGDKTSVANVNYTSALFKYVKSGGEIVFDSKQTADAPTVGESSHASKYCLHMDVTTAESAVAAGDFAKVQYHVTGSDFAFIHQQEITISFWHKHTKTGIYGCSLTNSAFDRSYVFEYTQSSTNTWEKATETLTLDSSGTWLLTEAGIGLILAFTVFSGSTYHATADTWTAGDKLTTSNQVAGGDNAANNFKLSQVGLYLGSTAPTFLSPAVSVVKAQVGYYVEQWNFDQTSGEVAGITTYHVNTVATNGPFLYKYEKRIIPAMSGSDYDTFELLHDGTVTDGAGAGAVSFDGIGRYCCKLTMNVIGTPLTAAEPGIIRRNGTATAFILADARH